MCLLSFSLYLAVHITQDIYSIFVVPLFFIFLWVFFLKKFSILETFFIAFYLCGSFVFPLGLLL
jgi:hypothetical protein